MVTALAGQDVPVIETGGVGLQMPFADDGRLVAGGLKLLGHVRSFGVEGVVQGIDTVAVRVLSREDCSAAGRADGVGDETVLKPHSLGGQAVDIRRLIDPRPVAADGIRRMVVGHDKKDVGARSLGGRPRTSHAESKSCNTAGDSGRKLSETPIFHLQDFTSNAVPPLAKASARTRLTKHAGESELMRLSYASRERQVNVGMAPQLPEAGSFARRCGGHHRSPE